MGRSRGFGSITHDSFALFRLAFATAPRRRRLALPCTISRRSIMQKVRSQPALRHRPPTACRCMVSGTFNSPRRGAFHLSVALLFTIGRAGVLSLAGWSPHVQSGFHGPRPTHFPTLASGYRTVTFCGGPFQSSSPLLTSGIGLVRLRSPLLTESRLISFPPGTEMYQFPGFALPVLCIQTGVTASACAVPPGCPIRKSSDQRVFGRSPRLIAAYNVLHRLCTPRHPPYTLKSLTTFMNSCDQAVPIFSRLRPIAETSDVSAAGPTTARS